MTGTVFSAIVVLAAGPYTEVFHDALRAYEQEEYGTAIEQYEQLIREDVVEPAVFYNLGNAYYRAGHLGAAIANYERTLALDPAHQKARDNLASALQEIERNLERPQPAEWESSLFFWHYGISLSTSLWLAVLSWCLFWGLLALRRWKTLPYVRGAAIGVLMLCVAFSGSAWAKTRPSPIAVASRATVDVTYRPQPEEPVRFELYEGDRVRMVEERASWIQIETASGERGWAPRDSFTTVGPPYTAFVPDAAADPTPATTGAGGV